MEGGNREEMKNVLVAFDILNEDERVPAHLKKLGVHFVFDINMDMTRKSRLVADGR